jgi:hypothetical protein
MGSSKKEVTTSSLVSFNVSNYPSGYYLYVIKNISKNEFLSGSFIKQ